MGALTRDARADDRVAENMPAVMRGPKPDTMLITFRKKREKELSGSHFNTLFDHRTIQVPCFYMSLLFTVLNSIYYKPTVK